MHLVRVMIYSDVAKARPVGKAPKRGDAGCQHERCLKIGIHQEHVCVASF